jgi:ParB-like chromosome segregation protein Spo0J
LALTGALEEIGIADAVIARETPTGLELIDGHLRQDVLGDSLIPVLLVDLTDEEADKLLLTLDPLAAMATRDDESLLALLNQVDVQNEQMLIILDELRAQADDWMPDDDLMNRISPIDASMDGHIRVTFPEEMRDEVTDTITNYVNAQGWDGVSVS